MFHLTTGFAHPEQVLAGAEEKLSPEESSARTDARQHRDSQIQLSDDGSPFY
jgi:hypothetical protein